MLTFKSGDIVRVPFPYTDRNTRQHRPALVISDGAVGEDANLLWVLMITSAENKSWTGDVSIPRHAETGLPVASVIRPLKIATIEAAHADKLGQVATETLDDVRRVVASVLSK
ncbi:MULTISPECIES: type II toxin-antitoxin system PemK/MazF family toxin [unclassified Phyllobacterium]|uniref:type II toxin-antitoxin system PemK/MazF family toxin n=1 Tax=unclassified Phyllobacterium TaxID=2638441 RepID=UPI001AC42A85|nr:type II toxin-antitoxin system PemK/MazF family toxin [Phyllobacterium sp.]MBQ9352861.1 type II toxin-antitoxin system PemK/MazF family toxin [Phyllobacterium sp.]